MSRLLPSTLLFCILAFLPLTLFAQIWKTYPYHQAGSVLNFPADEGHHPDEPIEWWYTNARVTGLTISQEQFEFASARIQKAGLSEKVELKLQDYRDETGVYDKIASIEMFEAVGEKYWPVYFGKLRDCLTQGGKAGLQIITIADRSYGIYRSRPDFIQRYVFPGGMLPSPSILSKLAADAGLTEHPPRVFPQDYARTLAEWRDNFWDAWERIARLGFDERFRRMWEFYLHYCEAGFRSQNIDVRQVFYAKP